MKIKNSLRSCAFAATLGALLLAAVPTRAQDGKFGFYAGYAFLHSDDGNLNGFRLAPEYRLKGPLSVVGDFSAEFGTLADTDTTLLTPPPSTFMASRGGYGPHPPSPRIRECPSRSPTPASASTAEAASSSS
jgi:hypothetical protein